jgi:branched-chain amino acid aminotransferase
MVEREVASINGKIVDLRDATIPVLDHCVLYGDGVFEGIRFINRKIIFHQEHLIRLKASANALRLPVGLLDNYEEQLFGAVEASGLSSGYVRILLTRGIGELDINPTKCSQAKLIVIVARLNLYPDAFYENGLKVIVARTIKTPFRSFDCRIKACNYLNNIMATWEFIDRGASEAIMTDEHGIVSEATVDNIFGVRNKTLFTPSIETNCLEGITRATVMKIAEGHGLAVQEGNYTPRDFMLAEEVFLTGTGAGVVPVSQIEQMTIGKGGIGAITRRIRQEYEARLESFGTTIS